MVGETPWSGPNFYQIILDVGNGCRHKFTKSILYCYKKLIEACWAQEMYERPSFSDS